MASKGRAHYVIRTGKLICEQIALGKTLQQALDHVGYLAPTIPQFWRWLEEHPDFREAYERARQLAADMHADKLQELSEEVLTRPKSAGAYKVAATILQWQAEIRNSGKYGKNRESKARAPLDPDKIRTEIKRLERELGVAQSQTQGTGEPGKIERVK